MRCLSAGALLGVVGMFATGSGAHAEAGSTRIVDMPFSECLSIIAEVAQEMDGEPVRLVSEDDLVSARIDASDGFVTVSCSRPDNKMTLAKSPALTIARMASR